MKFIHTFWSKPLLNNKFNKIETLLPVLLTQYAYSAAETFKTKYLGFYIYYLAYWIRNLFVYGLKDITAYRNIPFEREAVDKSLDFNYSKSNWFNYRDRILKNKEGN